MMIRLAQIFCVLIGLFAIFCLVDCSCGQTQYFECSVSAHHYTPAWVETSSSTDSDGNTHITSTVHDEEFHLICAELKGAQTFDTMSSRSGYYTITNDQIVVVKTRHGRWSNHHYLPRIDQ